MKLKHKNLFYQLLYIIPLCKLSQFLDTCKSILKNRSQIIRISSKFTIVAAYASSCNIHFTKCKNTNNHQESQECMNPFRYYANSSIPHGVNPCQRHYRPGALAWQGNQPCNLIVSPLTMQQGCQVALMRNILGIPVNFSNENVIWAAALGFPPPVGQIPYIQRALRGGSYLSDTACTICNLQRHLIYMNAIQN